MRLTLTLALLLIASAAHAQDDPLARGRVARDAGDHEGALAAFRAAWDGSAAPIARAEMAVEELALGHFVDAEAHASEALSFATDPEIVARADELVSTRDAAASHLGSLEVRGDSGCVIAIDDALVGTTPLPHLVRVEAGTHTVRATRPGYEPASSSVEVAAGAVVRAELAPTWIDDRPILERGGTGDGQRIAGWTGVVTGGLALVIASVALGVELDRDAFLRSDACAPISTLESRESHCPDAAAIRGTYTDIARALYISAAVFGAAGIVLLLTAPSAPSAPTARCVPSTAPGFVCQVTF